MIALTDTWLMEAPPGTGAGAGAEVDVDVAGTGRVSVEGGGINPD